MSNARYLDGPQWGCHGPSEALRAAKRELRLMGVEPDRAGTVAERKGGMRTPTQDGSTAADADTAYGAEEYDGGHIGGEVQVLVVQRELIALEREQEQWKIESARQAALREATAAMEDDRDAAEAAIQDAHEDAWADLEKQAKLDRLRVEYEERIRAYTEREALKVDNHFVDEAMWVYNESHREHFEIARAKVAREFEKVAEVHANAAARETMRQDAIERLFAQDTARFRAEEEQLEQLAVGYHERAAAAASASGTGTDAFSMQSPGWIPARFAGTPDFPFKTVFQQGLGGCIAPTPPALPAAAIASPPQQPVPGDGGGRDGADGLADDTASQPSSSFEIPPAVIDAHDPQGDAVPRQTPAAPPAETGA